MIMGCRYHLGGIRGGGSSGWWIVKKIVRIALLQVLACMALTQQHGYAMQKIKREKEEQENDIQNLEEEKNEKKRDIGEKEKQLCYQKPPQKKRRKLKTPIRRMKGEIDAIEEKQEEKQAKIICLEKSSVI